MENSKEKVYLKVSGKKTIPGGMVSMKFRGHAIPKGGTSEIVLTEEEYLGILKEDRYFFDIVKMSKEDLVLTKVKLDKAKAKSKKENLKNEVKLETKALTN